VRLSGNCFTLNRLIPSSKLRSVKLVGAFAHFPYVTRLLFPELFPELFPKQKDIAVKFCIYKEKERMERKKKNKQKGRKRVTSRECRTRKAGHID